MIYKLISLSLSLSTSLISVIVKCLTNHFVKLSDTCRNRKFKQGAPLGMLYRVVVFTLQDQGEAQTLQRNT